MTARLGRRVPEARSRPVPLGLVDGNRVRCGALSGDPGAGREWGPADSPNPPSKADYTFHTSSSGAKGFSSNAVALSRAHTVNSSSE